MKKMAITVVALGALCACSKAPPPQPQEVAAAPVAATQAVQDIFNGTDLTGWVGNNKYWSVQDGAITGRSTAEQPFEEDYNTFLVWQGGALRDFELILKARFIGGGADSEGNSGVQYRAEVVDGTHWVVKGYQADIDAAGNYAGMLYDELRREIVHLPRQNVEIKAVDPNAPAPAESESDELTLPPNVALRGETISAAEFAPVLEKIRAGEWVELRIVAEGNVLQHYLNGLLTAEVLDSDAANASSEGVLALQLHSGPPMTVQFKDIKLRNL
jgi:hypothetical protein